MTVATYQCTLYPERCSLEGGEPVVLIVMALLTVAALVAWRMLRRR